MTVATTHQLVATSEHCPGGDLGAVRLDDSDLLWPLGCHRPETELHRIPLPACAVKAPIGANWNVFS
jgi:hypothetical protein